MDWSFNWTAQGVSFRRGEMRFRVSLKEEASVDAKDQRVGAKAIPKLMLVSDLDNTMVSSFSFYLPFDLIGELSVPALRWFRDFEFEVIDGGLG